MMRVRTWRTSLSVLSQGIGQPRPYELHIACNNSLSVGRISQPRWCVKPYRRQGWRTCIYFPPACACRCCLSEARLRHCAQSSLLLANVFAPDVSRNRPYSQGSGIKFLRRVCSPVERRGKNLTLTCPVVDGLIDLALPLIRKFNDEAGPGRSTCHRKNIVQNGALLIAVIGFTQCVSERPVEIEHAWRFHQRSRFLYICERNCGHATGFNLARQQSHGPRAGWSGRDQDDEIDARLRKKRTNLTSGGQEITGIVGKAKAIVDIGHAANHALFLQLKQALEGKDQVRVADGIAAVVVFVRDTEICVTVGTPNDAK